MGPSCVCLQSVHDDEQSTENLVHLADRWNLHWGSGGYLSKIRVRDAFVPVTDDPFGHLTDFIEFPQEIDSRFG